MLFEHARGRDASIAGGKHRPAAGKFDSVRAGQMKPVKTDHEEEIEHHLAAAHGDAAARRQQPGRYFFPGRAPRIPPPAVGALLEPCGFTRDDKTQGVVDVRLEFVAAACEHDKVRKLLRALVEFPVLFVAQRIGRQSVGAGDLVVVRDDGVAGDVEAPWHDKVPNWRSVQSGGPVRQRLCSNEGANRQSITGKSLDVPSLDREAVERLLHRRHSGFNRA